MTRYLVVGDPVAHSLSPIMMSAAFRAAGIDATYSARRIAPSEWPASMVTLHREGIAGCNVTVPHKEGALVGAQFGLLEGAEAIFSMVSLSDSRFSFEPSTEAEIKAADDSEVFHLPQLAIKAAQLEDELSRYREDLPAENAGLFVVRALSTGVHPVRDLPFSEIYERIDTLPGVTMEELIAHEFVSAIKLRLAVAVLARAAVIEAVIEGAGGHGSGAPAN